MEKVEALKRMLLLIDQVRHAGRFKGRADLLKKLLCLVAIVETHVPMLDYNELCCKEAERVFNEARECLNEGMPVGQKD